MGQLCSSDDSSAQSKPASSANATSTQSQQQQSKRNNNSGPTQQPPSSSAAGGPRSAHQAHVPVFHGHREWPPASSAGDAARFAASQYAKKRGDYLAQSQAAWARGDKAEAKRLSDLGKEEGRLMEQSNAEAARLYFEGNNAKHDLGTIDLHGLYVEEAITKLEERLRTIASSGVSPTLVVIVGRGNHSVDHKQKIKPAMEKLMAEHRLRVAVDSPNLGCLTVIFGASEGVGFVHAPSGRNNEPHQSAGQCLQQ